MLKDPSLGLDMVGIGGLTSVLPVAYGFSKFLSGVLGARTSPTIILAGAGAFLPHETPHCLHALFMRQQVSHHDAAVMVNYHHR
jgi:hypothetical protein